jgi:hypothetical protein
MYGLGWTEFRASGKSGSGEPNGQDHPEARLSRCGRDLDLTVVLVDDDIVGDVQAQSRADAGTLGGKEGFEDAVLDLGWNPGPVVDDFDNGVAVLGIGA